MKQIAIALWAGFDCFEHPRIGDGRRVAVALQQEFLLIDAARHVDGKREQEIDLFCGARPWRCGKHRDRQHRDGERRESAKELAKECASRSCHGRRSDCPCRLDRASPRSHEFTDSKASS